MVAAIRQWCDLMVCRHCAGGRWAEGIGANPLRLLDSAREPFSMLPDFGAGKVLVSEATS